MATTYFYLAILRVEACKLKNNKQFFQLVRREYKTKRGLLQTPLSNKLAPVCMKRISFYKKILNLAAGELGDGFGSFGNGVLGQFTGKHEANSSLDLAAAEGGLLVVSGELSGFSGDALENVVDERVHDGHSFLGDTSVRVDLLQHAVDVGRVRFHALLGSGGGGGLFGRFCRFLGGCLGHGCKNKRMVFFL